MFRQPSRQIAKAVPRPRFVSSRPVHKTRPPPGLRHRSSTSLFATQSQGIFYRAQSRGEYIDIHDVSKDPNDYDVLISDIDHKVLGMTIAKELGIPCLSKATEADAQQVVQVGEGYIHGFGLKFRAIAPFVVCHREGRLVG